MSCCALSMPLSAGHNTPENFANLKRRDLDCDERMTCIHLCWLHAPNHGCSFFVAASSKTARLRTGEEYLLTRQCRRRDRTG